MTRFTERACPARDLHLNMRGGVVKCSTLRPPVRLYTELGRRCRSPFGWWGGGGYTPAILGRDPEVWILLRLVGGVRER